jgi:hypothetical protein
MTGKSDKDQAASRGEHSVLGNKQDFKKDEPQDAGKEEKAKDEIGHMGEASRQNKPAKDVR